MTLEEKIARLEEERLRCKRRIGRNYDALVRAVRCLEKARKEVRTLDKRIRSLVKKAVEGSGEFPGTSLPWEEHPDET